MFHLAAFYQSLALTGILTAIDAVPDQAIRVNGTDIVVPANIPYLLAEAALSGSTAFTGAQVESPSLRQLANQDIAPIVAAVVFGANPAVQHHFQNPRGLKGNESINLSVNATDATAADNYGLIWLADGALTPVKGNMFSVQATAAATNVAGTWVNSDLTFDSTLPAGTYNIVGMRAVGTGLIAARLVLVGAGYRPGVPAVNAVGDQDFPPSRYGAMGTFGSFDVNQPPTVDCLGSTGTAQTIILDLIKVA